MRTAAILAVAALAATAISRPVAAQDIEPGYEYAQPRVMLDLRVGGNVPTFDITDAAEAGPSFGAGVGVAITPRLHLIADADFGFHPGADPTVGVTGPDVNVYHYMGKVGYRVTPGGSPWDVVVNAGAGAMTFAIENGPTNTYPAINVGAKISYRLTPTVSFLLSPQGDIAFTDVDELGTDASWVWPFTAGLRLNF